MGWLDDLFGGRKTVGLRLSGLDSWIKGELELEASSAVDKAKPILESVNETVAKLRDDVRLLDRAGFSELDARYDKIVRTAKPSYVKSMSLALAGLDFKGGGFGEIEDYDRRLGAALDTIGTVGFGDGKFLPYAFPDEMGRIQSGSKKLLKLREELERIIKKENRIDQLKKLKMGYAGYLEAKSKVKSAIAGQEAAKNGIEASGKRLVEAEAVLETLRISPEYAAAVELAKRIQSLESEISASGSAIHSALSPLKSGLRKYEKTVLDRRLMKLVAALQEDSIHGFLTAEAGQISEMLDGFEKACRSDAISLKDKDKTLKRIGAARLEVTDELRKEYLSKTDEAATLKSKLSKMQPKLSEQRLKDEMESLGRSIEKQKSDIADLQAKEKSYDEDSERKLAELKTLFSEFGVELV